jgi:DNA-binding MarR family transcriptional regulator
MNLMALVEKLITEQGSPTLLKKRLGRLRDQISVLEEKNSALKLDNTLLKSKKNTIESHLDKARKEMERLNRFVQELEKDDAKTRLNSVTEEVLKMFFHRRRELSVRDVADTLSIDVRTARSHVNLLLGKDLIEQTRIGYASLQGRRRDPQFRITSSGREYVSRNTHR